MKGRKRWTRDQRMSHGWCTEQNKAGRPRGSAVVPHQSRYPPINQRILMAALRTRSSAMLKFPTTLRPFFTSNLCPVSSSMTMHLGQSWCTCSTFLYLEGGGRGGGGRRARR